MKTTFKQKCSIAGSVYFAFLIGALAVAMVSYAFITLRHINLQMILVILGVTGMTGLFISLSKNG